MTSTVLIITTYVPNEIITSVSDSVHQSLFPLTCVIQFLVYVHMPYNAVFVEIL